jgi:hypothetical protein
MAHIAKIKTGWRAAVARHGTRKTATFKTLEDAQTWSEAMERNLMFAAAMRAAVDDRFLMSGTPKRVLQALADIPFAKHEVLAGSVALPQKHGVYFLILNGDVRYVGKSKDVLERLRKHRESGWRFDSYNVVYCKEDDMTALEQTYIEAFMPDWNQQIGRPAKGCRINTRKHSDGQTFEVDTELAQSSA